MAPKVVDSNSITHPTKLNSCRGAGSPEQRVGKHGRNDAYMPCESALPVSVFANRKCRPPRAIQHKYRGVVQLVRTPVWGTGGPAFELRHFDHEHKFTIFYIWVDSQVWSKAVDCKSIPYRFVGSNPTRPTTENVCSQTQTKKKVVPD